jgi:hypothetical protein
MSDLLNKVRAGIEKTGYPLELRCGAAASALGWTPFHAVEYEDPVSGKLRELDLLIYKLIQERRVELRVSCKGSVNKQFVFFNEEECRYFPTGEIKNTPVRDSRDHMLAVAEALADLPVRSPRRRTVNFTVTAGPNADRDARALLVEATMSVVTSAHYRLLPRELLMDERGTVYFFVVVLGAPMYGVHLAGDETVVEETDYAVKRTKIPIPEEYWPQQVTSATGGKVPFRDVMYWFGDTISVEFVHIATFRRYLQKIEQVFASLSPDQLALFGKPWRPEHFPKIVGNMPSFSGETPAV